MLYKDEKIESHFFSDSTPKDLRIAIYDWEEDYDSETGGYYRIAETLSDDDFVLESANFKEGISDNNKFCFGNIIAPQFNIDIVYKNRRYKNAYAIVYIIVEGEYGVLNTYFLMEGYVTSDKVSNDKTTLSLEITNDMSNAINTNIAYLYNQYILPNTSVPDNNYVDIKLKDFIDLIVAARIVYIDYETLLSDLEIRNESFMTYTFRKYKNFDTVSLKDFLDYIALPYCANIYCPKKWGTLSDIPIETNGFIPEIRFIRNDCVFHFQYPSFTTYPSNNTFPLLTNEFPYGGNNDEGVFVGKTYNSIVDLPFFINFAFDDTNIVKYNGVKFEAYQLNRKLEVYYYYDNLSGLVVQTPDYEQLIANKPEPFLTVSLPEMFNIDGITRASAFRTISPTVLTSNFITGDLDSLYAPYIEPGDNIKIEDTNGNTYLLPYLNGDIKGINLLRFSAVNQSEVESD